MENTYQEFTEKLGKLQRNETQMTERQKVIYADQLKNLKRKIAASASEIAKGFITGGIRILKKDPPETKDECINRIKAIIDQEIEAGAMKKASKVLFTTYDADKFLEALLPIRYRVWYEGYGPYWCKHCYLPDQEEIERKGWGDYWAYNDIIGAWYSKHNVWVYKDGAVTIMLPPTMELIRREYKQEKERIANGG